MIDEMKKTMEIGSIFEIDPCSIIEANELPMPSLPIQRHNALYPNYFNTGRAAIESLLKKLKDSGYKTVFLPSFLCDSVADAAIRAGMELNYYKINSDLSPEIETINTDSECVVYVVQYFGQRIGNNVLKAIDIIRDTGAVIVEDISLSLLSEDKGYVGFGDYIVGSLRKWFPIVDGGILLSKEEHKFDTASASNDYTLYYFIAQILKDAYLKNDDHKEEWKQVFLSYNREAIGALFSDYTIRKMSRVSKDLMKGMSFEQIRTKRNNNFDLLASMLKEIQQVKILIDRQGTMTPLGMVILCEERDNLLDYMISKDIYCNVHWRSNKSTVHFPESEYLSSRCITIPCDQRYGKNEMEYIYQVVSDFYGV